MVYTATISWFLIDGIGTQPAHVKISGKEILVDCIENSNYEAETWTGTELEKGHYVLQSSDGGEATLHRFSTKTFLEGHCNENFSGGKCMWRIDLGEPTGQIKSKRK